MINVDEARELVNAAGIPFPADWKEQILATAEETIKSQARKGRHMATLSGRVSDRNTYQHFFLNAEQFSQITAVIKAGGFRVDEDFRIRYDGQPLTVDIFW